jgi:hypothetical protein
VDGLQDPPQRHAWLWALGRAKQNIRPQDKLVTAVCLCLGAEVCKDVVACENYHESTLDPRGHHGPLCSVRTLKPPRGTQKSEMNSWTWRCKQTLWLSQSRRRWHPHVHGFALPTYFLHGHLQRRPALDVGITMPVSSDFWC